VSPGRLRIETYPDRAITGRRPVEEPQRPSTDQILMWACLVPGHTEAWLDGDVARCAHLGCALTSEHTEAFAALVRATERRRVAVEVEVARREAAAAAYRQAAAADTCADPGNGFALRGWCTLRAAEVERGEP
jgi:hypothetical protein